MIILFEDLSKQRIHTSTHKLFTPGTVFRYKQRTARGGGYVETRLKLRGERTNIIQIAFEWKSQWEFLSVAVAAGEAVVLLETLSNTSHLLSSIRESSSEDRPGNERQHQTGGSQSMTKALLLLPLVDGFGIDGLAATGWLCGRGRHPRSNSSKVEKNHNPKECKKEEKVTLYFPTQAMNYICEGAGTCPYRPSSCHGITSPFSSFQAISVWSAKCLHKFPFPLPLGHHDKSAPAKCGLARSIRWRRRMIGSLATLSCNTNYKNQMSGTQTSRRLQNFADFLLKLLYQLRENLSAV